MRIDYRMAINLVVLERQKSNSWTPRCRESSEKLSRLQRPMKYRTFKDVLEFRPKMVREQEEEQTDIRSGDEDFLPHILQTPDSRP
jgi:hypothetical protein